VLVDVLVLVLVDVLVLVLVDVLVDVLVLVLVLVDVLVDVLVGVVVDVYPKGISLTAPTRRPSGSKKFSVIILFIFKNFYSLLIYDSSSIKCFGLLPS